jgi:hypothetical protein
MGRIATLAEAAAGRAPAPPPARPRGRRAPLSISLSALVAVTAVLTLMPATLQGKMPDPPPPPAVAAEMRPVDAARCLDPERGAGPPELVGLRARLVQDPVLDGYFERLLDESGVRLCLGEAMVECRGYFEPDRNLIAIRPGLDPVDMLLVAVHELRHVDQALRGFSPTTDFSMRETARLVYALEADAHALVVLFAWAELQAGRRDVWEAVSELEHYEDIAVAFAVAMGEGLAAEATRAAFRAWYTSEHRLRQYYVASCTHYLDALERAHRPQPTAMLPAHYFETLCLLPDGSNYGCHQTTEIRNLLLVPR